MLKFYLFLLAFGLCLIGADANLSQAQISGDGTARTRVTSADRQNFSIEGGQRIGSNLFHSFSTFSVPTNGSATFQNRPAVANILGRVTGPAASSIDGLLRTQSSANLFLINPNGILFGPNARLNIGGSFLASTADRVLFEGGDFFSASESAPLLTVRTAPIGLGFGPMAAPIRNQSRVIGVPGRPEVSGR